jgi:hypothetical protein
VQAFGLEGAAAPLRPDMVRSTGEGVSTGSIVSAALAVLLVVVAAAIFVRLMLERRREHRSTVPVSDTGTRRSDSTTMNYNAVRAERSMVAAAALTASEVHRAARLTPCSSCVGDCRLVVRAHDHARVSCTFDVNVLCLSLSRGQRMLQALSSRCFEHVRRPWLVGPDVEAALKARVCCRCYMQNRRP